MTSRIDNTKPSFGSTLSSQVIRDRLTEAKLDVEDLQAVDVTVNAEIDELQAAEVDKVTNLSLAETLLSYVTNSSLATSLANYVTSSSLATSLANYVTSSSLATSLANYVTSSSLATTLLGYALKPAQVIVTQSAAIALPLNTGDYFKVTGLAQATTISVTGTAINLFLILKITDNGTAHALTWSASFESSGTKTLPTTTVAGVMLTIAFIWNDVTSKWTCVGVS
jgi:hypothetical protein